MTNSKAVILVIDDERPIRRFLRTSLQAHGLAVFEAETGQDGLVQAASRRPDVIVLDLGLPDIDGTEVTRRLREWTSTPIIILSVRDREADKIAALDAGADDYLTKPFGVGELMARIRVSLRHTSRPGEEPVFEHRALKIDLARHQVWQGGQEIDLTPTEYDLLVLLVQSPGRVLTHRQMLRAVWGVAYENESHLLRVNISNLRRKLEPDPNRPEYILTEPGVGYRLSYD